MTTTNDTAGKPWPHLNATDEETEHLYMEASIGWCWEFPGWQWVADQVNGYCGGNRTAEACRKKYAKLEACALSRMEDEERLLRDN